MDALNMRIALSLAILVAVALPVQADEVGVVVDGEGTIQPQLTAQLADWLTRHGHTVVASPLPAEAVPLFTDAMKTDNLSSGRDIVEKHATAASLVYARVDVKTKATSSARDLTVSVFWLVKGHDATSQKQDCARCTDQLLRAAADAVMRRLLGGGALGHVKLKSSPPGARISIDGGAPIGITPLDWDLPTGKHTIRMDMAGHRSASRDVVIASDNLELVVETLEPLDDTGGGGRPSRVLPVLVLVAGGAMIAGGGVMIAIDEDVSGKKLTYRDTGPAGVGIAVGGAVVAGLGGYLLYRTGRSGSASTPSKPTSTPVAAITRDMAYVGWLGRF